MLSFLVILGRFLDFVVGPEGDARTKDALAQLANEGGARTTSSREFVLLAANVASNFFAFWFGKELVSREAAFHCFVLSLLITSLIALAAGIWDPAVWDGRDFAAHELITIQVGCLVAANFVVDFLSLITTRWVLIRMISGPAERAWRWLLVQLALTYLFVVTAMNASFSSIAFARGMITGYFFDAEGFLGFFRQVAEAWWLFFSTYTIPMFLTPIAEGRLLGLGGTNLMVFSFTACLPGMIYVVTIGLGVVVDSVNWLTSGGVHGVLKSLVKDKQPIFLRLSVVASGLLGFLSVLGLQL
jgi:hypothetical protein